MAKGEGAGDQFQRETQYHRDREPIEPRAARRPSLYKSYGKAKTIPLDRPTIKGGEPLWDTIRARRSVRRYSGEPISLANLSQLLWATQGITKGAGRDAFRAAPSAGGLYPVETYLVVHAVEGVERGVYHYGVEKHSLEQLKTGNFRAAMKRAALGQSIAGQAAAVFLFSAVFERSTCEYGQRAYRYVYLDAGHAAENLALAASALGLVSCPVAAFYDEELNALVDLDGQRESVVYLTTVGKKG
ncbi:MAG: SagB/ThcOx family dehydrogenase [Planctomycetota bacterium]